MITRFVADWCVKCESLTYVAAQDEVCNCEDHWKFKSEYNFSKDWQSEVDRKNDPIRKNWIKVTVTIEEKLDV